MALTAKKVYAILKRQISDMEAKLNSPVRYRGTVATADLLPLNPDIGDMYNIESKSIYGEAGMNVAWNGIVWDTMGAPIDMSLYIKSSELADWVKQQNKPAYTAEEVGALPADTKIPSKTSDLQNDSGFLTKIPDNYLSGTDKTLSVSGKAADAKAVGDKNVELLADILSKLDKNQGSENFGKIAGINESGDIVPMFPVSVDYNEETNCLEFGSDQKMELNKGINLDSTLTKTGYAADAGAVGEITNSLQDDIGDFNGLGSFNDISKTLEFGYVNELGQYSVTRTKQNMFMPLIHCAPGYKFVFANPLDIDAWLSIHLYSTELLYKGKISAVLCEKEKTISYTVEEECFIRASVNKRYNTASTDEELSEVQKNFYVSNVDWLSPPVEKYDNLLKIDINTFAYYRKLVERKTGDFTFCYQTDTHYSQSGTYKTLDNLKNLVNVDRSILPNFCSNLGDVTHGYLNRTVGMDDYMKAMSVYKKIRTFLPVQGNHENNTLYTFQHTQNRSIKEIVQKSWFYNSTFNPFCVKNNGVIDENKLYYSVDFDNIKVIVLDTNDLPETEVNSSGQLIFASSYQAGIRQEQLDWLIDTLKMPNPKPVIILSHHSLSAGASKDTNTVYNANAVRGILEAYNTSGTFTLEQNPYGGEYFKISVNCDFTGAKEYKGANVIGCFAGHTHADAMYTINNIHYVVSDSSVSDTSENKEVRKSDATSDVIETVKIDISKKEVNIIRFGYGIGVKDRSFTY